MLKNRFWGGVTILIFILIICIQLTSTFHTPLYSRKNKLTNINLLPQGWGFFTKDPKDVKVMCFVNNNFSESIITPHFSYNNFFGIKRTQSRICFEIGSLSKEIKDSLWHKATSFDSIIVYPHINIETKLAQPIIKGKITIANMERLPWAWHKFKEKTNMPFYFSNVNVK